MTVFIFGLDDDIHANAIAWALKTQGIGSYTFNPSRFPCAEKMALDLAQPHTLDGCITSNQPHSTIDLAAVRVVWSRRMQSAADSFNFSDIHPDDLNDVVYEVNHFITGLYYYLADVMHDNCMWVNTLEARSRARSKALQLRIAEKVGFAIPATLIGNHPEKVEEFFLQQHKSVITKPFLQRIWLEEQRVYSQLTNLLHDRHLENPDAIQFCPAIYQQHIQKKFELRIVVLGQTIIAAKLDSQAHDHAKLDWRQDAHHRVMRVEPYAISATLRGRIHAFMAEMGLQFGSFDFIVTEDDTVVFLEINEQGQFLFLEEQCPELSLLSAVCDFFGQAGHYHYNGPWPCFADYLKSPEGIAALANRKSNFQRMEKQIKYAF